jgi:hypothetical protein
MKTRKRPISARVLTQWVDAYARERGQPPARVRNWISHMILGGALERGGFDGAGRKFTIKGGVALEMRLRHLARATRDLDLILLADDGDPVEELAIALSKPYEGFSFRLRGEPEVMPNGACRVEVSLDYVGKSWGTIQVDVSRKEGSRTEVDMVEAIPLMQFGLEGPDALPCLSLPHHVAQKIHGMTLPPPPGRRNERFRDLVDLLLLREWITDFEAVQRACREVFEARGTHAWPPFFTPPDHWVERFAAMAAEVALPVTDLHQAAIEVRQFIVSIDSAAEWVVNLPSLDGLTATTWYFAVGPDGSLHRVSARIGEGYFTGARPDPSEIPMHWQRDPGGIALIGVVLFLRNRKPVYVEGVSCEAFALAAEITDADIEFGPAVWNALASELLRHSQAPVRAVRALSVYLSRRQCRLPCLVAGMMGVTTAGAHWYRVNRTSEWFLWDLRNSEPIQGSLR